MRLTLAWAVGLATVYIAMFALEGVANTFGLKTWIDFGYTVVSEYRFYDQESDGTFTALGKFFAFISITAGYRAGMAVMVGHWSGGVDKNGNFQLLAAFMGFAGYAAIMTTIWKLFAKELYRAPAFVSNVLELFIIAVCIWGSVRYYKKKMATTSHTAADNGN